MKDDPRPAVLLDGVKHFSRCLVAVDADNAWLILERAQDCLEISSLDLGCNSGASIQADLADNGCLLDERFEAVNLEGALYTYEARMASHAPDHTLIVPFDGNGCFVQRAGRGEDDPAQGCNLTRFEIRLDVGVGIDCWQGSHWT